MQTPEEKTYLIRSKEGVKIGKSTNPEKRLQAIKVSAPSARLIAYGSGVEEKRLHRQYKHKRIAGEWYKLSRTDTEDIIRRLNNELSPISKNYVRKMEYVIKGGKYKGLQIQMMTSKAHLSYMKWYIRTCKKTRKLTYSYKIFRWWIREMERA